MKRSYVNRVTTGLASPAPLDFREMRRGGIPYREYRGRVCGPRACSFAVIRETEQPPSIRDGDDAYARLDGDWLGVERLEDCNLLRPLRPGLAPFSPVSISIAGTCLEVVYSIDSDSDAAGCDEKALRMPASASVTRSGRV